jgi:hypothetical protein
MKLVGEDFGSWWLEILDESYAGTATTKMLLYLGDRTSAQAMDIKILKTRDRTGQVTEANSDQLVEARAHWQGILDALVVTWQAVAQEDATVPAGTFAGCFRRDTPAGFARMSVPSHAWWHAAVPLTGLVKAQGVGLPVSIELVAFGVRGARSEIQ